MARLVLIAPGRGSYTRSELGYLGRYADHPRSPDRRRVVERADALRRASGGRLISDLDSAEQFRASLHLAGEEASALTFTCTAADAALLSPRHSVEAVLGNSMGWYSALHVSGVLGFEDAFRLVDTMGGFQKGNVQGGQIIYPTVDADWRPLPGESERILEVVDEVRTQGGQSWVGLSIRLGGYLVLAGNPKGLDELLRRLPKKTLGGTEYPFQLAQHSAFHTPLMADASQHGLQHLSGLDWQQPRFPLIDGRGKIWRRYQSDPAELLDYTLRTQVTEPFDFTAALRVAVREFNPDHLVLLGPGETLGGAIAQLLISDGWRGLHSKMDFQSCQNSSRPVLISLNRPSQARLLFGEEGAVS